MNAFALRPLLRHPLTVLALAILTVGPLAVGAFERPSRAEPPADVRPVVETAAVVAARPAEVRFSVVTRSVDHARVGFTIGGRVVARDVRVGETVRAGQVIARLDGAPFAHEVAARRAARARIAVQLEQAERDEARAVGLASAGATGREELEKTRSGVRTWRGQLAEIDAGLAEAERRQRESILRAPFVGVVTDVYLEPGELTAPGQPIVALVAEGAVEAELRLPAAWRDALSVGDTLVAQPALGDGARFDVNVASIGIASDGPGRLFPVRLTFPARSSPGHDYSVFLARPEPEAPSVPSAAVTSPVGGKTYVFVVRNAAARRVPVRVKRLVGDRAVVNGAIDTNDRVVVAGHAALLDGDAVIERAAGAERAAR